MKENETGALFTMDDAYKVVEIKGIVDAKQYLYDIVALHPTATDTNKRNANRAIGTSLTHQGLQNLVVNFILAYKSPSLKVLNVGKKDEKF